MFILMSLVVCTLGCRTAISPVVLDQPQTSASVATEDESVVFVLVHSTIDHLTTADRAMLKEQYLQYRPSKKAVKLVTAEEGYKCANNAKLHCPLDVGVFACYCRAAKVSPTTAKEKLELRNRYERFHGVNGNINVVTPDEGFECDLDSIETEDGPGTVTTHCKAVEKVVEDL